MIKFLVFAVIVILAAAGLGYYYGLNNSAVSPNLLSPTPSATSSAGQDQYKSWQTCTNTKKGFTIMYPSNWVTLATGESCIIFDPSTQNLTTDKARVVINTTLDTKGFNDLKTNTQKSTEEGLLLNSRVDSINNQPVDRVEVEATGVGSKSKGTLTTNYFFAEKLLVATTTSIVGQSDKDVLQLIVNSLKFN